MSRAKKIAIIGGARPNFMKIAPLCRVFKKQKLEFFIVNTGQHFSKEMSQVFFNEFNLRPDYNLQPRRNSVIEQFADIMKGIEKIFLKEKPALVIVVGDVNSTLAGALVANKIGIKLAHVEAGLRSFNNKMPEEFNRKITDHLSDYLFVTAEEGLENLKKEGIVKNVFYVGNIMIDTLKHFLPRVKKTNEKFYFCTLHRPENVDNKKIFSEIIDALEVISKDCKIYFPLHPRTEKMARKFNLLKRMKKNFIILKPLNYLDSLFYQKNARLILTDSGGIQEEASYLGVPCITLRNETERPITLKLGTNTIGGVTKKSILAAYKKKYLKRKNTKIPLWDGKAAERIGNIIKSLER
jgi:UDP-N-acetylglucosamine 2-epimerase (non-hydrolysing)